MAECLIVLESLVGGWKGHQDGACEEFLRWFPPYSLKGLLDRRWERFVERFGSDALES